jgi:hypothetical protein
MRKPLAICPVCSQERRNRLGKVREELSIVLTDFDAVDASMKSIENLTPEPFTLTVVKNELTPQIDGNLLYDYDAYCNICDYEISLSGVIE